MKAFATLLDRLSWTAGRNAKLRLIADYLKTTPDPDRGYALAILTGSLDLGEAKPNLVRKLIAGRVDPTLFALSYDYVGDLSETVALLWPEPEVRLNAEPGLAEVVVLLRETGRASLPHLIETCLDRLDETGRWAFLKLITGALRIGVSARLAKTALSALGTRTPDEIEEVWHGLRPPYDDLLAWVEGRRASIETDASIAFRPPMLAHPLEASDLASLDPADYAVEWKWDGIRAQAIGGSQGLTLYSRSGEDIGKAFPDLAAGLALPNIALDGEILVVRDGAIQPFTALQQRLNRKTAPARLLTEFPAHFRAYDLLYADGEDLRALPFRERRTRLEVFATGQRTPFLSLSPLAATPTRHAIVDARARPGAAGAGADAAAVEGVMLKRWDSPYLPGRPKGHWWKWKRDPYNVDAVLMYAQRGHGKRSSFYSDYTFGLWRDQTLTPVGKAYFGFTDEELAQIDRFIRANTVNRFGPVREVRHEADAGLVFEVAFEGLNRSGRNRSGLAMRFPRISRIRWDKRPGDADRLETLEALMQSLEG